jgi:hypothetical protein
LDKELARKWVEALRSGNYEQAKFNLQLNGKFCCLGVLCEISGLEKKTTKGYTIYKHNEQVAAIILPLSFRSEIGLPGWIEARLTKMNDSGDSFEQIALYIEKEFLND